MTDSNKNTDNLNHQTEVAAQLEEILEATDKSVLVKMVKNFSFAAAMSDASVKSSDEILQMANANILSTFFISYSRVNGHLPDKALLEGLNT